MLPQLHFFKVLLARKLRPRYRLLPAALKIDAVVGLEFVLLSVFIGELD